MAIGWSRQGLGGHGALIEIACVNIVGYFDAIWNDIRRRISSIRCDISVALVALYKCTIPHFILSAPHITSNYSPTFNPIAASFTAFVQSYHAMRPIAFVLTRGFGHSAPSFDALHHITETGGHIPISVHSIPINGHIMNMQYQPAIHLKHISSTSQSALLRLYQRKIDISAKFPYVFVDKSIQFMQQRYISA